MLQTIPEARFARVLREIEHSYEAAKDLPRLVYELACDRSFEDTSRTVLITDSIYDFDSFQGFVSLDTQTSFMYLFIQYCATMKWTQMENVVPIFDGSSSLAAYLIRGMHIDIILCNFFNI